ncbi:protein kinase [candidate division KSB1 bacterium]|nr:protein kinase [candidate division KSB1 bacterium]NIR71551.1 protein kinase [candidate division KSB1 bacterium]NIS26347.1 protein kinase [candidate division KSB1 bacterium]NIT73114.1 protein kinase [candidate division KSB1 bacterium]NIU27030.1 protein kinase [candidate division KSB1 bacterium]
MAITNQIGGIQIFAEIYQGATTYVYKGYQSSLERFVLLKVLRPEFSEDQWLSQRFEEEAKLVGRIQHPNVVAIYDYGREDDVSFIAAEFVEGLTLHDLVERSQLPVELACFIVVEAAKGLQAAHNQAVLHQDIKPSNILISNTGQVKLTDFGMASVQAASQDQGVQEVRGTLAYMSPEQILGDDLGTYSDIFSLGATFYEMLMGSPAFLGQEERDYLNAILNTNPVELLRRRRDLPAHVTRICQTMVAKDPSQRYQTCGALIEDLQSFQSGWQFSADSAQLVVYLQKPESYAPLTSPAPPEEDRVRSPKKLNPAARIGLAVILMAGLAFTGWFYITNRSEELTNKDSDLANEADSQSTTQFQNLEPPHEINGKLEPQVSSSEKNMSAESNEPQDDLSGPDVTRPQAQTTHETATDTSGYLQITCIPWAGVFINGDSLGTTPLKQPIRLPVGAHKLLLKNPQFPVFTDSVAIEENETTKFELSLWGTVGRLNLEVSPWAEVYIDDEYRDTVPPQDRPLVLTPGTHALALKHPALGTWQTSVEVSAGETVRLRFNLRNLLAK